LHHPTKFRDTISELVLALYFKTQCGLEIEFIDDRGASQSCADMRAILSNEREVKIECKHLHSSNNMLLLARKQWPAIHKRIRKSLKRNQTSAWVYVLFRSIPTAAIIDDLARSVDQVAINACDGWTVARECDEYQLWLTKPTPEFFNTGWNSLDQSSLQRCQPCSN
jgi:hypothetical protein